MKVQETAQQPFLQAPGTRLALGGTALRTPADVESHDYPDAQTAAQDAAAIEPDGNPETMRVDWVAPPHFFCAGQLIVLYVGADPAVVRLIGDLLGPQFAGA